MTKQHTIGRETATNKIALQLALDGFRLNTAMDLPATGVTALFGVSGAGKTTLLRCLAGLEPAVHGRIRIQDETWLDSKAGIRLAPHQRALGYVFQDGRLFPHLSTQKNLEYGLGRRNGRTQVTDFNDVVALLGLENLLHRRPAQLSGGEQQRVAIGRALLGAPRLLLLDEPLANLDRARKEEILPFLDRLSAELSIPMLYVSHSLNEVVRLCDHMVVLREGGVLFQGRLEDVLLELARREGGAGHASVMLRARVLGHDAAGELTLLEIGGHPLRVPGHLGEAGGGIRLRVFADDVSLVSAAPPQSSVLNTVPASVRTIHAQPGGLVVVELETPVGLLLARLSRYSANSLGLAPGLALHAQIKGAAIRPENGHGTAG